MIAVRSVSGRVLWLVVWWTASPTVRLAAQDAPEDRGPAIAREADERVRGFGDLQARVEMVLREGGVTVATRELEYAALEISPTEERTIVYFQSPPDLRGTALLTHAYAERDNEQWLYLPALRRTKRIAESGRSAAFMGSEFSYEDLVPMRVEQFTYRFVRADTHEDESVFVVERRPRYEGSGYSRQEMWVDTTAYKVLRVDSWDERGRATRMLVLSEHELDVDGRWRPRRAVMRDLRSDRATELLWSEYRIATGLTEAEFSRAALGRPR